jgi:outer membrane protein assembly factor BamB
MNVTSTAIAFLISLAVCPCALMADQPQAGSQIPESIDRGMMIDALEMQRAYRLDFLQQQPETRITVVDGRPRRNQPLAVATPKKQEPHGSGWPFQTDGEIFSFPCFDEHCIYFGACDGVFRCLDKKTGTVRWERQGLDQVDSAPALHKGIVFFTAIYDTLYALNSDSGGVKWKATIAGVGYRSPKLLNQIVYIAGEDQLVGLDPDNGKILRRHAYSGDGRDFSWNSKAIVVAVTKDIDFKDDTGIGSVVCFAYENTKPRWTTALGGACLGTIVCDEDNCYLGARDGFFYAIRMRDGKVAWRIDCRKIVPNRESDRRLDDSSGRTVWADEHVIDAGANIAFTAGHQLINAPSTLALAEKRTGKLLWSVVHPTQICGRFLAADGILVAVAEDREMLVVKLADGTSVCFSPLPAVCGTGLFADQPRGEFAGVSLDHGQLFVVGADAHVWRLPLASVSSTLDWPIAHGPDVSSSQRDPPPSGTNRGNNAN